MAKYIEHAVSRFSHFSGWSQRHKHVHIAARPSPHPWLALLPLPVGILSPPNSPSPAPSPCPGDHHSASVSVDLTTPGTWYRWEMLLVFTVEPALSFCYGPHLATRCPLYVWLDLIYYFVGNFCVYAHEKYWSVVFFSCASSSGFGLGVTSASQNDLGSTCSSSVFWKRSSAL